MNNRAISFLLLSSAIMMTALILQTVFMNPPPPQADAGPDVVKLTTDTGEPEENGEAQPDAADPSGTPDDPEAPATVQPQDDDSQPDPTTEQVAAVPPRESVDRFVTIGSLAADGSDRFLVTLNELAGTIHRVELNYRNQKNGRLYYRDLEYEGGYLGCLDCIDTENGCRIRTVGDGTPASLAVAANVSGGLQVGDVVLAINDQSITTAAEMEYLLAHDTSPGTTAQVRVKRDESEIVFDVELTDKPIELLRPEESSIDPGYDYPESFVLSLLKPGSIDSAWPDLDPEMRSSNWTLLPSDSSDQSIAFEFVIPESTLKQLELAGPISVIKRYRLPTLPTEDIYNLDSRTFHLDLEIEIANQADQKQTLAYELDGPTGAPTETWWYAMKIHGRSTAIGYVAGARDVVGSNGKQPYVFYGTTEIVKNQLKTVPEAKFICDPLKGEDRYRKLNYAGVDTLYFNISLIPEEDPGEEFFCNSITVGTNGGELPKKNVRLQKLVDCTFFMAKSIELKPESTYRQTFEIFCGPKEADLLDQYGLDDNRSFGWFAWCSKPLMSLLHFFYNITFQFSYGLAIIMLTVLVRSLMIPISRKAALNAQMMQHLQPQMKEIADKYKDDMEKRASAQRELFKRYKYNPFGGCFMMFFQLPIFIGLYRGLSVDIALRDQPLIPGMSWCTNLSGPDQLLYWGDWMPTMLGGETGWLGPYLNILPLVTMVLFIVQQKLFMPPATDDQQKMMQKVMTFMMVFMGVMFFKVASGLCLYFITSSIWGIVERKMLPKPTLDTDKLPGGSLESGKSTAPTKKQKKRPSSEKKKFWNANAATQNAKNG